MFVAEDSEVFTTKRGTKVVPRSKAVHVLILILGRGEKCGAINFMKPLHSLEIEKHVMKLVTLANIARANLLCG